MTGARFTWTWWDGRKQVLERRISGPDLGKVLRRPMSDDPTDEAVALFELSFDEWYDEIDKLIGEVEESVDKVDRDRYPHSCPKCGGPAYVGLASIDCRASCR